MTQIGNILHNARLKKGYSIDELQQITKIPRKYLLFIENNEWDKLPGTFYTKNFVEQYAQAVDLDPNPLLFSLQENVALLEYKEENASRRARHQTSSYDRFKKNIPLYSLGVLALLAIVAVFVITIQERKKHPIIARPKAVIVQSEMNETTQQTTKNSVEKVPEKKVEQHEQTPKIDVQKGTTPEESDVRVTQFKAPFTLTFSGGDSMAWLGVMVNQNYVFQNVLQPQTKAEYTIPEQTKQVDIVLGAADFVKVALNGKDIPFNTKPLGPVKHVLHVRIEE